MSRGWLICTAGTLIIVVALIVGMEIYGVVINRNNFYDKVITYRFTLSGIVLKTALLNLPF